LLDKALFPFEGGPMLRLHMERRLS